METIASITIYGNKFWKNKKGQYHRDDGSAVIKSNGDKK